MSTTTNWKDRLGKIINLFGVLAALLLIVSISIEAFSSDVFTGDTLYTRIQLGVCIYFLLDFLLLLALAPRKLQFFFRNFILVFLSIPYSYLITRFSIDLSHEAQYMLRFLPIVRGGAALVLLVRMVVSNRISGLFITYLTIFFSLFYFSTLMFYVFEYKVNPMVLSYPSTLWWAAMTVTTLGSNIIPVTTAGKISTVVLAIVGMTAFPIFTAYITTVIQRLNEEEKKHRVGPFRRVTPEAASDA